MSFDMTSYVMGQKSGGGSGGGTGSDLFVYIDDPTTTQNFKPSDILDEQFRLKKCIVLTVFNGVGYQTIIPEVAVNSITGEKNESYLLTLLLATDPDEPLQFSAGSADDYFTPYSIT